MIKHKLTLKFFWKSSLKMILSPSLRKRVCKDLLLVCLENVQHFVLLHFRLAAPKTS